MGTVYLVHLDGGLPMDARRTAQHYIGWARNVSARLAHHRAGSGANFLRVAGERGIAFDVVRTWPGDRTLERRIKRRHEAPRLCPTCRGRRPDDPAEAAERADSARGAVNGDRPRSGPLQRAPAPQRPPPATRPLAGDVAALFGAGRAMTREERTMDDQQTRALRLRGMRARAEGRAYAIVRVDGCDYREQSADELDGTEAVVATVRPDGWVAWTPADSLGA